LDSFTADDSDIRVIMLSLSKSASGTNLMIASHIILVDPMSGSKEEAQAFEAQAIGRAYRQGQTKQVTIVRFIIKDTLEHTLYLRNSVTGLLHNSFCYYSLFRNCHCKNHQCRYSGS